ncbi:MAG: efflux RND transporter permease subunit [Pseudomonadota bacterium]
MWNLFYRKPRLFALAVLMMLAAGASALATIGRQEDPTITNLFATVVTPYPGADPARVEALVTEKIEDELREIPQIDTIESTSRSGISVVQIELSQFITDVQIEQAWSEIRDALSDAARNFPPGVPQPDFDDNRTGGFTSIAAIMLANDVQATHDDSLAAVMRRYSELLQDRLRGVGGTKFVDVIGAQDEEVSISVNPHAISSLGLTVDAVAQALARADTKVEAGQVRGRETDLIVEVAGEFKSLDRIRQIPIREDSDGRIVRIGDVSDVSRGLRSPPVSLAYIEGVPAVLVAARMAEDLQVDAWTKRINDVYDDFQKELPEGLEFNVIFDQSAYTADRLFGVMENMAIGMAIVVAVLIFSLGWRAAIVVATILPLATIVSIFGLQASGIPIHQMSVTGLIVALGLLVDAGIVMTDDIRKRLTAGENRAEAVAQAVRRLAIPLAASTVTTVLAFMPMALLPGPAGDFVGSIALAVIIMLFVSLGLALTITPALAGWMLKRSAEGIDARDAATAPKSPDEIVPKGSGPLHSVLLFALNRPRLAMMAALIAPVVGFGSFPTLKPQFFPGVDRNQLYVQVKLPEGRSHAATDRVAKDVYDRLNERQEVSSIAWVVGESAPPFYYNMLANQDNEPTFAEFLVTTTSPQATEAALADLQTQLDGLIPEARVTVRGLVQGPPVNAPVEIRVVGPELAKLREIGDVVRAVMVAVPAVQQARTQIAPGAPKVELILDEEKVRLAGLDLADVARQFQSALEGARGGSLIEGSEELPVNVRLNREGRDTVSALRNLEVMNTAAATATTISDANAHPGIPITALGRVEIVPAETPIYRRNGERINTVQGFVERTVLPEAALKVIQKRVEETNLQLPAGYRFEVGGDSDARDETLRNLLASLGVIVALTVATIVLTFGSYRLAALAGVVAILSMGLSLLALAIFRYPFGIQAVIGVIGSIGVSINAAIIIITALQQDARALAGDVRRIADVVTAQSRHIISTTLTTFGGFLPLILAGGGFWPPFAMAIAGGVLLSTLVSFFFVPPAFALLTRSKLPGSAAARAAEYREAQAA